jgi:hypothetical protein
MLPGLCVGSCHRKNVSARTRHPPASAGVVDDLIGEIGIGSAEVAGLINDDLHLHPVTLLEQLQDAPPAEGVPARFLRIVQPCLDAAAGVAPVGVEGNDVVEVAADGVLEVVVAGPPVLGIAVVVRRAVLAMAIGERRAN